MCLQKFVDVLNIVESIAVVAGTVVVIMEVFRWKAQRLAEKQMDLAEEVLQLFAEAVSDIAHIRSPYIFDGEGKSRRRENNEAAKETEVLDRAYITVERYQSRKATFSKLSSLKPKVAILFDSECIQSMDQVNKELNQILNAANMLGSEFWLERGVDKSKDSAERVAKYIQDTVRYERLVTDSGSQSDPIRASLEKAEDALIKKLIPYIRSRK
jgi:hypothetical protein